MFLFGVHFQFTNTSFKLPITFLNISLEQASVKHRNNQPPPQRAKREEPLQQQQQQ